jgi:drug/metabolite transporter (DMT)-like permease
VITAGALGFGAVIVLQNLGIQHTSVSHAAVLVGAVPVLVAVFAAGMGHARPSAREWLGYAVASGGVVLVAGGGGGGATVGGDALVLSSVVLSALFIAVQPRVLDGRDPAAVTAVQFLAGGIVAIPVALLLGGGPAGPVGSGPVLAFATLALVGTLLPFWLFAYGQSRVSAQLAGVFVNLEPVVGAALGWLAFANPVTVGELLGAASVLGGIVFTASPRTPAMLAPIARAWDGGVEAHTRLLTIARPWHDEFLPVPVEESEPEPTLRAA